jgi:lambda family phage portal protein
MKASWFDKAIGRLSPGAGIKRLRAKAELAYLLRAYDAAGTNSSDDWKSAKSQSANMETRKAQKILRDRGRDAGRNNPYAIRGISAIVGNTVGAGILPEFSSTSSRQLKLVKEAWKKWGETTLCDAEKRHNFYGMQAMVMRNVVESGEILYQKDQSEQKAWKLRLLESDFINSEVDKASLFNKESNGLVQGIEVDDKMVPVAYHLYTSHPYDYTMIPQTVRVPVEQIGHVFRQDRPGQLRGVSWLAPSLRILEDLKQFQEAVLIRSKGAASFMAFVEPAESEAALSESEKRDQRALDFELVPGMAKYLRPGEKVTFPNLPTVDSYADFCRQHLRSASSALGITYEALTNDYSQVNYSSGRMGHLEMRKNVDMWRWQIMVPQFCEPAMQFFLQWASLTTPGLDPRQIEVKWVPPAWSMIDPNKEYSALQLAVRNGFMSAPQAILELGGEPDETLDSIEAWNEKLDERKIILDSDPRNTNSSGASQAATTTNGDTQDVQNSQTDASQGNAPGGN